MNLGLLLCISAAAFLVDVRETHGQRVLGEFVFSAVMLVLAVAVGVLLQMVYRRLRPAVGYGVFLRCCFPGLGLPLWWQMWSLLGHHKVASAPRLRPCGGRCGLCCHHKGGAAAPPL